MSFKLPFTQFRDLLIAVVLAAAIWFSYGQMIGHGFIHLDDNAYVTANPMVRDGLSAKGVLWAVRTPRTANWHPVTWLSHMVDVSLFGMNPAGHHLTSLLLHALNSLLLFFLFRDMTGQALPSALTAALFALHPLHVESVAWIAERKDLLSTLFMILTLWGYREYVRRPGGIRYLGIIVWYGLALMSKPMAVTLPFVLLLLDFWPLGRVASLPVRDADPDRVRSGRSLILEKAPLFAMALGACIITWQAQERAGAIANDWFPLTQRVANAIVSYVLYLEKMAWPVNLAIFYPHPGPLPLFKVLSAGIFILTVTLAAIRVAGRFPWIVVGWLWFLGMLVPVIGIVQVGGQAMADRYTYFPLVGIAFAFSWSGAALARRWRRGRPVLAVLACLWMAGLCVATHAQVARWHDSVRLFTHSLSATRDNALAHMALADALADQNRIEQARRHYRRAIELAPDLAAAHNNLGNMLRRSGRLEEAEAAYRAALKLKPGGFLARMNLSRVLFMMKRTDKAIAHGRLALKAAPPSAEACVTLGILFYRMGQPGDASEAYRRALRLSPSMAEAHNNLGIALVRQGKIPQAIRHFAAALENAPSDMEIKNNLLATKRLMRRPLEPPVPRASPLPATPY